jgi:hypothetical protein
MSMKTWSEILGEGGGGSAESGTKMRVNLTNVLEDKIKDHEKFVSSRSTAARFTLEYTDMKMTFEQKGWTIYFYVLYDRVEKDGKTKDKKVRDGMTFGSEGVLETIKMIRADKDGVEYERPKPVATELDPAQKVFEMEQFRKNLQRALQGHDLFVSAYVSHIYIFVIYHDIMFAIRPDDYGNYEYEILERRGDLETKQTKVGKTVGQGGVIERIKELRSAWDLTHDPPGTCAEDEE